MKADKLQAAGDLDGQRVWIKILKAIDTLQGRAPAGTRH